MNKIVVTIHGIHTNKTSPDWQERYAAWMAKTNPEVKVFNFKYGYVLGVTSWLFSWVVKTEHLLKFSLPFQRSYIDKFIDFLSDIRTKNPDAEISIVAHSLGTWITNEALGSIATSFGNIVLIAGVISAHVEKLSIREWIKSGHIKSILAVSSHNDLVVEGIAQYPYGHLGYWGFLRADHDADDRLNPQAQPYPPEGIFTHMTSEDHCGVVDKIDSRYAPFIASFLLA